MTRQSFYAVANGRTPDIYMSWDEAHAQVDGYRNAKHKKFRTREEAEDYMRKNNSSWAAHDTNETRWDEEDDLTRSMQALTVQANTPAACLVITCEAWTENNNGPANVEKSSRYSFVIETEAGELLCTGGDAIDGDCKINRAQYIASLMGLEMAQTLSQCDASTRLRVRTRLELLVNIMTDYIPNNMWRTPSEGTWKTTRNTNVENQDVLKEILALTKYRQVTWEHFTDRP